MKFQIMVATACLAIAGGSFQAKACNPLLNKNFGKHVAPIVLPAEMLAKNNAYKPPGGSIVGLWHDVHTASDGTLFLEGFDTWNQDGTENELGNLPPAAGSICVGVFKRHGTTVELTAHVTWLYNTSGDYQGTLNIVEQNKVSADGNSYTGTFDAKMYDPSGTLFNEVTGTNGRRTPGELRHHTGASLRLRAAVAMSNLWRNGGERHIAHHPRRPPDRPPTHIDP